MKILIVSDSHGKNHILKNVIEKVQPIDMLIHLGDFENNEDEIRAIAGCKVEMVSGNNDYFSDLDKEQLIKIGNYTVFMTHGHRYSVNSGLERLQDNAIQLRADIAIFGHTHRPLIDLTGNVWLINPGSISYPRQDGRVPTFIIMDIDSRGEAHFSLNYVHKKEAF